MKITLLAWSAMIVSLMILLPVRASAHCDTMDGPVVAAAKQALEKGDITTALKWVKQEQESEIRRAFHKTLAVRKQSAEAKELADLYFFETLVRVHRSSEGEPYTGLKPAGTPVEPILIAADQSIESGKVDSLLVKLTDDVIAGIRHRHERVVEARKHADESITAGRAYVAAYVDYVHYVESLHKALLVATDSHAASKAQEHH
jgi:hypothetical protein